MMHVKLSQIVNYAGITRYTERFSTLSQAKSDQWIPKDRLEVRFGNLSIGLKKYDDILSENILTSKGKIPLGIILLHMVSRRQECDGKEGSYGKPPEEVQSDEHYQSHYYLVLSQLGVSGDDYKVETLEKLRQVGLILPDKDYDPDDPEGDYFHKASLSSNVEEVVYEWAKSKGSKFLSEPEKYMLSSLLPFKDNLFRNELEDKFKQHLKKAESILHQRIVGQDDIINHVSKWLRKHYISEIPPISPLNFIFVGPTGVGKTEMAKAIQELLTGNENDLVRFDMNTFQDKHHGDKFGGAPPGYVGYEEGGQITQPFLKDPAKKRVILLDEIEKGYHSIYQQLLQLLGEGRFADSQGRMIDAKNAVVVMTSNLFTKESKDIIDKGPLGFVSLKSNDIKQREHQAYVATHQEVRKFFSTEFMNRVNGGIQVFNYLTDEQKLEIFDRKLNKIIKSYETGKKNITLELVDRDKILAFLMDKVRENPESSKNHSGARLVEHILDACFILPLNEYALGMHTEKDSPEHEIPSGSRIRVILKGDNLEFNHIKPKNY